MNKKLGQFIIAVVIYSVFMVWLYLPYLDDFNRWQYLLIINSLLGALGGYILSRRWVAGFVGSFFAGCVYGFGPFLLSLAKFHPSAGFLVALIPWLFCPAAFVPKRKWRWLQVPLSVIPFLAIVLFFKVGAELGRFPVPVQISLSKAELVGLLSPTAMAQKSDVLVGFYHVPIAALVIGLSMLFVARRYGVILIIVAGIVLAFCGSFLEVSPVVWLAIPSACLSVVIGEGTEGMMRSGYRDRKWILISAVVLLALAVISLLLGTKCAYVIAGLGLKYTRLFTESAKMYVLGAVAAFVVFFMARGKIRVLWLRHVLIGVTLAVDIVLSARCVIDKIM